jgi:ABC-2 type transport system ATP-binding protein
MQPIIQVEGLSKRFDDVQAVNGISFEINNGELFGFLGPNGAGKTTTIKMLTGLARPSDGSARVAGVDIRRQPKKAQGRMGIVPDESNLYPELTGFENLNFCAALYGLPKKVRSERAQELLAQFNLEDAAGRKFAAYSKGMKRKLTIAAGIIHRPSVLFLDEPTTGIDVASARQIRQMIARLHAEGVTILLTTHYIEEAERLCDRIAFIVKGKIIRVDTVANLLEPVQDDHIMLITLSEMPQDLLAKTAATFPAYRLETLPGAQMRVMAREPIKVSPMVNFLEANGTEVMEARRMKPTLEDVFVKITGVGAAEMRTDKGNKGGQA